MPTLNEALTDPAFRKSYLDHLAQHPEQVRDGPVHAAFGLSYANYLVAPRALLQSMPFEWQEQFASLWQQFADAYHNQPWPDYQVRARDSEGRYIPDPFPHYRRAPYIPPSS